MLRRLFCLLALVLATAAAPAWGGTPLITGITPLQYGYIVYGAGFGSDRGRVAVIENSSPLSPSAILAVSEDRILVRSGTGGEIAIAVRVGDQMSAPAFYAVGHAPAISAIAPAADGYTIFGSNFGTDRGRVIVIQNSGVLPPAALAEMGDGRIDVRARVGGIAMIAVRVGSMLSQAVTYAPGRAPAITGITPLFHGYAIIGRGFGADARRVAVAENGTLLPPDAVLSVAENRIEVRSTTADTSTVLVRVGAMLSTPATYRPPTAMPVIAGIAPAPEGYVVYGNGFGADPGRVAVIENDRPVAARDILAVTDSRIVVRSRTPGFRSVAVHVGSTTSRPMLYGRGQREASRRGEVLEASRTTGPSNGGGEGRTVGPTVTLIVPDADGYTIVGSGFGTDRRRIAIIEDGAALPPGAIRTVSDSQIIVHSPARSARLVAVRIGGATLPAHKVPAPLPPPVRR
jgi:hypothetical protein